PALTLTAGTIAKYTAMNSETVYKSVLPPRVHISLSVVEEPSPFLSPVTTNETQIGWTICPSDVYRNEVANASCSTAGAWTKSIDQITAFSTSWQNATTDYSRQNLSILNVELLSSPQPYIIDPSYYRAIWTKLLVN